MVLKDFLIDWLFVLTCTLSSSWTSLFLRHEIRSSSVRGQFICAATCLVTWFSSDTIASTISDVPLIKTVRWKRPEREVILYSCSTQWQGCVGSRYRFEWTRIEAYILLWVRIFDPFLAFTILCYVTRFWSKNLEPVSGSKTENQFFWFCSSLHQWSPCIFW